jgi:hypothetical protein
MVTIHLTGHISESGEIKIDVPEGMQLPAGDMRVTLEVMSNPQLEDDELTPEEIEALNHSTPKTGAEIVAWLQSQPETGWDNLGMTGAEWVEEQRRKRQEQLRW